MPKSLESPGAGSLRKKYKKRINSTSEIHSWATTDGKHFVEEINSTLEFSRYYILVEQLDNGNQHILSRHRKRASAVKALDKILSKTPSPVKKRKKLNDKVQTGNPKTIQAVRRIPKARVADTNQ